MCTCEQVTLKVNKHHTTWIVSLWIVYVIVFSQYKSYNYYYIYMTLVLEYIQLK